MEEQNRVNEERTKTPRDKKQVVTGRETGKQSGRWKHKPKPVEEKDTQKKDKRTKERNKNT